jgi:hypothetical protein
MGQGKIVCRAVLLSALLVCLPLWGQTTAEVRGRVLDPAHHPVVSAFVVLTAHDTSVMRAATTDDAGEFHFSSLPVGNYNLQVTADGFAVYDAKDIRAIRRVVSLEIVVSATGSAPRRAETVDTAVAETSDTQLGVVTGDLEVTELPLKSRDAFDLLQLQPGVQSTLGADLFFRSDLPGVVSVSGGRARSNNNAVNGGNAGDQMVNFPSVQPSPDSISAFRVISHNYDAALGRNSGSVLSVVTKSGGGAFHGSAYEFLRNDLLNSKGYFNLQTPAFKQNDFGGTLGGPIRKDKTFFFFSYEGQRVRQGMTAEPVVVPTPLERGGDFSAGPAFAGVLQDDAVAQALNNRVGCTAAVQTQGGAAIAAGTPYAAIFPGNVIPSECFDPTAADLLHQFVPAANVGENTYFSSPKATIRKDQVTLRVDHNINSQQQLSFYYYGSDGFDAEPFSRFQASGANLPGFGNNTRERFQQVNLAHAWTINAKTTNELRLVYYRDGQGHLLSPKRTNLVQNSCATVPASECFNDPANPGIGITPGYGTNFEGVPFVSLIDSFAIGNNPNGTFSQKGNVYQVLDSYSKIIGNHSLKFGTDIRNQRLNQQYLYAVNGDLEFVGGGTNDVGFSSTIPTYLLGLPDSYWQGSANAVDVRATQFDLFARTVGNSGRTSSSTMVFAGSGTQRRLMQGSASRPSAQARQQPLFRVC